jgi:hypothetical protein
LLIVAFLGARLIGRIQLSAAIAEADKLDPGWRMRDLEAAEPKIAENRNSALVVLAANRLILADWPTVKDGMIDFRLNMLPPEELMSEEMTRELREDIAAVAPAVVEARRLLDKRRGRYSVTWTPDIISTNFSGGCRASRKVATLLRMDAALLAQDGKGDEAIASARSALNAARSLGDEPSLVSQLARASCRGDAIDALLRTLAQGETSSAALTEAQRDLEEETDTSLLLTALRGERAFQHELFEGIESGRIDVSKLMADFDFSAAIADAVSSIFVLKPVSREKSTNSNWRNRLIPQFAHARQLRHLTRCVELAKLPAEEQETRFN